MKPAPPVMSTRCDVISLLRHGCRLDERTRSRRTVACTPGITMTDFAAPFCSRRPITGGFARGVHDQSRSPTPGRQWRAHCKLKRHLQPIEHMSHQTRVLVTGAGGFIGHHLVSYLKGLGYWVRGVDIKLPEYEPTQADE